MAGAVVFFAVVQVAQCGGAGAGGEQSAGVLGADGVGDRRRGPVAGAAHVQDRTGHGDGGTTSVDNLGPLCRYHHNAKTHFGWTWTVQPSSGQVTWTSPTGHSYPNPDGPTT